MTRGDIYQQFDRPLIPVLFRMERAGITVDPAVLAAVRAQCVAQMDEQAAVIREFGVTNPNSVQQLQRVFYGELGAPVLRRSRETGAPSTDAGTLATMQVLESVPEDARRLARAVVDYREPATLIKMFLDVLPRFIGPDGRIHPTINQHIVETGRLSMTQPNPMNIPHRRPLGQAVRRAFIPRPGWVMVKADMSQLELRIMGALSGDPILWDAYRHEPAKDIHAISCQGIFGFVDPEHRQIAKPFNFGTGYGQSGETMSRNILKDSGVYLPPSTCDEYIAQWWTTYRGVAEWREQEWAAARARGYKQNWFGRRDYLGALDGLNRAQLEAIKREACNFPVQSTGADVVKRWMIQVDEPLRQLGATLLLQVHDELVVECPPDRVDEVGAVLVERARFELNGLPLVAETHVGPNWQDMS